MIHDAAFGSVLSIRFHFCISKLVLIFGLEVYVLEIKLLVFSFIVKGYIFTCYSKLAFIYTIYMYVCMYLFHLISFVFCFSVSRCHIYLESVVPLAYFFCYMIFCQYHLCFHMLCYLYIFKDVHEYLSGDWKVSQNMWKTQSVIIQNLMGQCELIIFNK